ncbi:alkaline phosphatase D family protein [Pseudoduganella sp. GCM10020061]|uniref:alkaline phosphatase D family protein n=1 Tax=Pseudoduganella sp. GCM10020061 TaxID=3317345 RepID=UPI00363153B7
MEVARRLFLARTARFAALSAAGFAVPGQAIAARPPGTRYPFTLGVASGSPLPDAVVIWTRIIDDPLGAGPPVALNVRWEMATDEQFRRIVARGAATALPQLAHSIHVDVQGLEPGRWYWYRFMLGDAVSPVGRTRTAPAAGSLPGLLKLAVASCQHWEFGSYAAHRHIASASPDLVAFLGDYIYEWGAYALEHPTRARRVSESFTLDEYRRRYAQYKSDRNLQAAHHAAPWIVTWDDHEVANDYAGDRDERLDVQFRLRRAAAYQAFYEHMPIRPIAGANDYANARIYQRYDWGRLARFHVLDNRQYRAVQACTPTNRGGSTSVWRNACAALADPNRSLLGPAQERWLDTGLRGSAARWNIIAQQTLMAESSQTRIVRAVDGRFWNDGWDGYSAARTRLLESLRGVSNPVVLGGDVHTFYANELRPDFVRPVSRANPVVATEFVGTSVTSGSRPQARTEQYVEMNPHVKYGRSDKRGYMLMEITPGETRTIFLGLDDVRDERSGIAALASFRVRDGRPGPERI